VLDRGDEAVPSARDGFDETRICCVVSQRGANLVDGEIDSAVEVDKGVSPDVLVNFVPRDNLPCMLGKHEQHGELLRLELYRDAALPQLAVDGIKLK
jgi:hypothetical protein